jgi:transposase
VLNGIFWMLRSGAPWRDLPERCGPRTTCYNRFNRWRQASVWDRLMDAITAAHEGEIRTIDSTSVRAHQAGGDGKGGADHCLGPRTIVLADKTYGADRIRQMIQDQGATPNIPLKSNRCWKTDLVSGRTASATLSSGSSPS